MYYSLWRRLLKPFWWLVVAYTMLVLTAIYTFQFEDFPGYWKNFTGFTEEQYVKFSLHYKWKTWLKDSRLMWRFA